jgi:6-pyruvoyl-tetrahydropterin synthase
MSYENPQLSFADPLAFSKGFQQTFSYFQNEYKKEKEERDRIAKEQDQALAKAYNTADLSGIAGIDTKIMEGLQSSIDSVIKSGGFATAKASDQALMLRKVSTIKNTVSRLGELSAIPPDEWDVRNSPKISQLRNAIISGDPNLEVSGDGLDLKITGKFGTVSLEELASAQFKNKNDYRADLEAVNSDFRKEAAGVFKEMVKTGANIEEVKQSLVDIYKKRASKLDSEILSGIYSNEASDWVRDNSGTMYFNDPSRTSMMDAEQAGAFKNKQIEDLLQDMAEKEIGSVYDWGEAQGFYEEARSLKLRAQRLAEARLAQQSAPKPIKETDKMRDARAKLSVINNVIGNTTNFEGWISDFSSMARNKDGYKKEVDPQAINKLSDLGFQIIKPITTSDGTYITGYTVKQPQSNTTINIGLTNENDIRKSLKEAMEYAKTYYESFLGREAYSAASSAGANQVDASKYND